MSRTRRTNAHTEALQASALVSQALDLVRQRPLADLTLYLVGAVPFFLASLYFWLDLSRNPFAVDNAPGLSLLTALCFCWMKFWQTRYALSLQAALLSESAPPISLTRQIRVAANQGLIQASGFLLLPIAALLMIPYGWCYAFYQNATLIGGDPDLTLRQIISRSIESSKYLPRQNHMLIWLISPAALLILIPLLLVVGPMLGHLSGHTGWILQIVFVLLLIVLAVLSSPICALVLANLLVLSILLPNLLRSLFGIETVLSSNPLSVLNSSTVACAFTLTYLLTDPITKAAYVLRCFYAESKSSGADLHAGLRRFRALKGAGLLLVSLLFLMQPATSPAAPPNARQLQQQIEREIQRSEYAWRLPREKVKRDSGRPKSWMARSMEWMSNGISDLFEWIREKLFKRSQRNWQPANGGRSGGGIKAVITSLLVVLLVGLIALLTLSIMRSRRPVRAKKLPAAAPSPPVDLEDETLQADALPTDAWRDLALKMRDEGHLRLALRASFLSLLSTLDDRGLIRIRRFKTNATYQRELRRTRHAYPDVQPLFIEQREQFECTWYGEHRTSPEHLERALSQLDALQRLLPAAPSPVTDEPAGQGQEVTA